MEAIKTQTRQLEALIKGILTVSRFETIPDLVLQPLDLNQMVARIGEQFNAVAEERLLVLDLDLDQDLPPLLANEIELHRALSNLIENALHYTPREGAIHIRTFRQGDQAVVSVRDTGMGIHPDDMPHIFEHFYRAESARAMDAGGTGLGLAIVRKIVELHGGSIEVESEIDKGSTFRVRLPIPADNPS